MSNKYYHVKLQLVLSSVSFLVISSTLAILYTQKQGWTKQQELISKLIENFKSLYDRFGFVYLKTVGS